MDALLTDDTDYVAWGCPPKPDRGPRLLDFIHLQQQGPEQFHPRLDAMTLYNRKLSTIENSHYSSLSPATNASSYTPCNASNQCSKTGTIFPIFAFLSSTT